MKKPFFTSVNDHRFRNWHQSSTVGGRVERYYTPRNAWDDGSAPDPDAPYAAAIAGLVAIVRKAQANERRVRPAGGAWSLNNVMYSTDYMINTQHLTHKQLGLPQDSVAAAFTGHRERLVFAQCGVQIKSLNLLLEHQGLQIPTSGASNGQTIAGAVATGTHGSNVEVGSMADFVRGLHVVADDGEHWWLERESDPVVSDDWCAWLGATPKRNDALFDAAVVGFGSFGIIHGVLFEALPLHLLTKHVRWFDHDDVRACLTSRVPPGGLAPHPWSLSVVVDPYHTDPGDEGAVVQAIYKGGPIARPPVLASDAEERRIRSPDAVALAASLSDAVPFMIPPILRAQLRSNWAETPPGGVSGSHGQIFGDVLPTGGGTSTEFAVDVSRARDAVDLVLEVAGRSKFGSFASVRFVKGSAAHLAFTRFPITATIEMPGVDSKRTRNAYTRVFDALESSGIPHAFHWGQRSRDPAKFLANTPADRVDRWLTARRAFLPSAKARRTFSNELVALLGLAD